MFAVMPSEPAPDFLDALCAARRAYPLAPPLRALADELVHGALALLFPHFGPGHRAGAGEVRADHDAVARVLRTALTPPLLPTAEQADQVVATWMAALPALRHALLRDARAIHEGDPAAESLDEVILAYPGFYATAVHRLARVLHGAAVPVFPRLLAEHAHRVTGIDIHPGASIGDAFAIDHGTGIVIGETTVIGNRVRLYQGVTLGALAVNKGLARTRRHPTIGDDVVIYANATILGGETVIGDGSIIGGNVWLTASVPPRSVVQFQSQVRRRDDDGLEFHI